MTPIVYNRVTDCFTVATKATVAACTLVKIGRIATLDVSFQLSAISGDTTIMTPKSDAFAPITSQYIAYSTGCSPSINSKTCYFTYWSGNFVIGNGVGEVNTAYRAHATYATVK